MLPGYLYALPDGAPFSSITRWVLCHRLPRWPLLMVSRLYAYPDDSILTVLLAKKYNWKPSAVQDLAARWNTRLATRGARLVTYADR